MALALAAFGIVLSSFAAAAPNALVPRQASASSCTTNSFTIPSWYVQGFKTGASDASFGIQNRATGFSTALTCKPGSGPGWSCSSSDTTLQVSLEVKDKKASVQVKNSWSCNDRNPASPSVTLPQTVSTAADLKSISFAATGIASIPLVCEGVVCKSSNPVDLVRGSLTTPFAVTPNYAEGPPGHSQTGCSAVSEKPQWALNTIIFLNETGDGAGAVATQSIQFQVKNLANGYVAGCLNYFNAGNNEDPAIVMNCGGGIDSARRNRYSINTVTTFNPRSLKFTINETWYCDDIDAAQPVSYTGTGTTTLPLKCTTSLGRTACEADSVPLSGSLLTRTPLVPYSIEDPIPTPDGCTISSVVSPAWTITNFEVVSGPSAPSHNHGGGGSTAPPASPASVGFNIKLNTKTNSFDYPVFVTNKGVALQDDDKWWPCSFGTGEQPLAPRSCKFQYEETGRVLKVDADWVCVDLDAGSPIVFNGVATAKLPQLECEGGATGAGSPRPTRCGTEEGVALVAEVKNVTWKVGSL